MRDAASESTSHDARAEPELLAPPRPVPFFDPIDAAPDREITPSRPLFAEHVGVHPLDAPPRPSGKRRRDSNQLTHPQVRILQAWRQLRAHNPWQQPTTGEVAHVLGITVSSAHRQIIGLCELGILVRIHRDKCAGRIYALSAEAAARPHLVELVRLATDLVRLSPDHAHAGDGVETYAALWARARALVQDIASLAARKSADTRSALRRERKKDGEIAAPPTPS
jgi:DNA-binding MarR family transcriptional regulator